MAAFVDCHIDVNPGGVEGRDPPDFGLRGCGVAGDRRVVVNGSRRTYSLFCIESMLESVFLLLFIRKKEKKLRMQV